MDNLVSQLLEDMTAAERQAFYALVMMDMSESLFIKKDDSWGTYYFNLSKTLRELFPNRRKSSGVYKRVILFDRVVLKVERIEYDGHSGGNIASEAKLWKKYEKKNGRIYRGIYLAPTYQITESISVQKRFDKRGTLEDVYLIEDTVGENGKQIVDDVHTGNFRVHGETLVLIDFGENY